MGNIRFGKNGTPLLLSVDYRGETIGSGTNGITVTDETGTSHDLTRVHARTFEIVKRGPLYVEFRYSGRLVVASGGDVSFVMTVGMPNSKAWVKSSLSVEDPDMRLREISFHMPFTLGPLPWVWDFGTDRWTYGSLRAETDAVVLTNVVTEPGTSHWQVATVRDGREQLYETADPTGATVEGWGHLQGGQEAVAFAVEGFSRSAGAHRISIDGSGQTSYRFAPLTPIRQHSLTVYEHFVPTPVQIGAATSPASMLNPLVAVGDRAQYARSGVQPPDDAVTPSP